MMNVSARRVVSAVAMLLLLAACEAAIEPPLPHDPEPVPPPTVEWVPVGATIVLPVEKGIDEGSYISDEEWLTMIEWADDAFRRSYIRVHVVPAHLVTVPGPPVKVDFIRAVTQTRPPSG